MSIPNINIKQKRRKEKEREGKEGNFVLNSLESPPLNHRLSLSLPPTRGNVGK
jgi:hypothetical protein